VADQSSVLRFIDDNFSLGRIDQEAPKSVAQGGSFDQVAGSLDSLFNFERDKGEGDDEDQRKLILDPSTGEIAKK
jgi:phospholipase C